MHSPHLSYFFLFSFFFPIRFSFWVFILFGMLVSTFASLLTVGDVVLYFLVISRIWSGEWKAFCMHWHEIDAPASHHNPFHRPSLKERRACAPDMLQYIPCFHSNLCVCSLRSLLPCYFGSSWLCIIVFFYAIEWPENDSSYPRMCGTIVFIRIPQRAASQM